MMKYPLVRHILNEPQTNLSFSNTPHAMQQKEFSTAESIIASSSKMFLQFCENIAPACEPNARVWFDGNCCIGYCPVASARVIFDLHKIPID